MIGSNSNPGLTVLMVESLYKRIESLAEEYDCEVVCSYLEVYNETIKDLLRPDKELSIREDGKKGIIISDLSFYKPRGPHELLKLLRSGNRARTQHATDLNAESSRSHAVFEVKICLKRKRNKKCHQAKKKERRKCEQEQAENIKNDKDDSDEDDGSVCGKENGGNEDDHDEDGINKVEVIQSKLVMVDLAGSERGTAATNSSNVFSDGARQREGASINKSLLALASCISALADGKCHVPYRNSKLTRLLKDSLNGLCTTVMIANVSPSSLTSEDTYNTLKYADRAKSIVAPVQKQKNVFMEDLIVENSNRSEMAELHVKNVQLQEELEEERLKRELVLKELEKLQRKNVKLKSGREKSELGKEKGMEKSRLEGDQGEDVDEEECVTRKSDASAAVLTEDKLPPDVHDYIEVMRERARIFEKYVEFASENRLREWIVSCKKLKTDMADFLGRLPVEDENYVWFSKLKNEVNNSVASKDTAGAFRNNSSAMSIEREKSDQYNQKKYAVKLKNLTQKLELMRQNCMVGDVFSSSAVIEGKERQRAQKMVAIPLEDFLELKRSAWEREGNERLDQFYQQLCQQINNQLMTSGVTLMNALKLTSSLYLQLRQVEESTDSTSGSVKRITLLPSLQQEYKELLRLVYGPEPPPPASATAELQAEMGDMELQGMDYNNNHISNSGCSSNVNNGNLQGPLSVPPPHIPPQLSNLGRKSSLIMDDLASMRKLVERPLLIQLASLLGEEDDDEEDSESEQDLDLKGNEQGRQKLFTTSNSTFSRVVTTTNTTSRKSLSTSYTIYETPQPPPVTRAVEQGGESSPELPLPSHSHHRSHVYTARQGGQGEDDEETRYEDDDDDDEDVHDNDHHYIHPPRVDVDTDDNDLARLSSQRTGAFHVEASGITLETTNRADVIKEDEHQVPWNSLPTTSINSVVSGCNLVNPSRRKNSTSFEIIFDRKEKKRKENRGRSGRCVGAKVNGKSSSAHGPSVLSALSRQKISESQLSNGNESGEWTTTGTSSTSCTATGSSASTSAENMMMTMKADNGMEPGPVLEKKTLESKKRLSGQALIKDYHYGRHHLRSDQKQRQTKGTQELEENGNKNCSVEYTEGGEGITDEGNPSTCIYQLNSLPSPSVPCIDALGVTSGIAGNKSRFRKNEEDGFGERQSRTTRNAQSFSSIQSNKTEVKQEVCTSSTGVIGGGGNNKIKTTTGHHQQHYIENPNPQRRQGHQKEKQQEEKQEHESKEDIGSWRNSNHNRLSRQHNQQCSEGSCGGSKNTGGKPGKSLNPSLSSIPTAGHGIITCTPSQEFPMSVQGQGKNQQKRLHQYRVTTMKKSIALHPSKASTDLIAASGTEKVNEKLSHARQQGLADRRNVCCQSAQQKQQKQKMQEQMLVMGGSTAEEESEWEVRSGGSNMINMPNTNQKNKQQRGSQHSLLESGRSSISHHNKTVYHTNCKTFTISRESVPTANMPVISGRLDSDNNEVLGEETVLGRRQRTQWQRQSANYLSSNDDVEAGEGDYDDESQEEGNDGASSCYSNNSN